MKQAATGSSRSTPVPGRAGAGRRHGARPAFSLVESLVAITLLAMAGMLLLLATEGVINTSQESQERALAESLARQLLDEVLNHPLQLPDTATPAPLDPSKRATYATVWDYDGYRHSPPVDPWGIPCGKGNDEGGLRTAPFQAPAEWYAGLERHVTVRYVDPFDVQTMVSGSGGSDVVQVAVTVVRRDPNGAARPLARAVRLVPESVVGGW